MRTSITVLAVLVLLISAAPRAEGQTTHAAPQSALDSALQQHVSSTAADRETVLRVIENPEVTAVAERVGVDLTRAAAAIATLDGQQLTELAAQAQQVDQALAGGQMATINLVWLIIGLLVLILIIVAVN